MGAPGHSAGVKRSSKLASPRGMGTSTSDSASGDRLTSLGQPAFSPRAASSSSVQLASHDAKASPHFWFESYMLKLSDEGNAPRSPSSTHYAAARVAPLSSQPRMATLSRRPATPGAARPTPAVTARAGRAASVSPSGRAPRTPSSDPCCQIKRTYESPRATQRRPISQSTASKICSPRATPSPSGLSAQRCADRLTPSPPHTTPPYKTNAHSGRHSPRTECKPDVKLAASVLRSAFVHGRPIDMGASVDVASPCTAHSTDAAEWLHVEKMLWRIEQAVLEERLRQFARRFHGTERRVPACEVPRHLMHFSHCRACEAPMQGNQHACNDPSFSPTLFQ